MHGRDEIRGEIAASLNQLVRICRARAKLYEDEIKYPESLQMEYYIRNGD